MAPPVECKPGLGSEEAVVEPLKETEVDPYADWTWEELDARPLKGQPKPEEELDSTPVLICRLRGLLGALAT